MIREQHLKFCKKCVNRRLDMKVGLLCNLTGEMADFENECKSSSHAFTAPPSPNR